MDLVPKVKRDTDQMSTAQRTAPQTEIRDAATVIVLRDRDTRPKVLMGQRGATAAFMPNKFVFPGGAVDSDDAVVPLARQISPLCTERLADDAPASAHHGLTVAAIRELWEETGQVLGHEAPWPGHIPEKWRGFAGTGHMPSAEALQFVFRAITPPGRPRRFDARFFMLDAEALASDLDDFDAASDELSHLQWIAVDEVRNFDLPFITEVVLAEVAARAQDGTPPASVPFFKNTEEESLFLRLNGAPSLD